MAGFKGIDAIKGAIDTYATGGTIKFFTLKNDQDKAEVRFLHKDDNDLDVLLVHEVQIGGKKKYVECLKTFEKPCALCEQQMKNTLKMFLGMFVLRQYVTEMKAGKITGEWKDVNQVNLWERGRDNMNRILNLINKKGDLRKHVYEILRNGKAGDTATSYDIDPFDEHAHAQNTAPDDLPKRDDIYGFVMQMSYEQMANLARGAVNTAAPTQRAPQAAGSDDELPF